MDPKNPMDPKNMVADGYDRLYEVYADWGDVDHRGARHRHIDQAFVAGLQLPARALDLGCGTGRHATAYLVERGLEVVGIDISALSIKAARAELHGVEFIVGDMSEIGFDDASFDLVTAFYSLIHVPREEHGSTLRRVADWLKPGGFLVATFGTRDNPASTEDAWLGTAPMFWSTWDAQTNMGLLFEAGVRPIATDLETQNEDGQEVSFLWVMAQKPRPGNEGPTDRPVDDLDRVGP
jgi:ubiquinone/menaquinone biosynthesis C-methylase UbiE